MKKYKLLRFWELCSFMESNAQTISHNIVQLSNLTALKDSRHDCRNGYGWVAVKPKLDLKWQEWRAQPVRAIPTSLAWWAFLTRCSPSSSHTRTNLPLSSWGRSEFVFDSFFFFSPCVTKAAEVLDYRPVSGPCELHAHRANHLGRLFYFFAVFIFFLLSTRINFLALFFPQLRAQCYTVWNFSEKAAVCMQLCFLILNDFGCSRSCAKK